MAELEGGREGAALSQARIAAVGKVSAKHQKYIWRKRARGERGERRRDFCSGDRPS